MKMKILNIIILAMYALSIPLSASESFDLDKALRDAESGDLASQRSLMKRYFNGDMGVPQDFAKAVFWAKKVAEQNDPLGLAFLGYAHAHGLGVEKDIKKSIEYYEKGAESGHIPSQRMLTKLYYNGDQGLPQDFAKAVFWSKKSAEQNYPESFTFLGFAYLNGLGVEKDDKKAVEYYKKGAELGSIDCMYFLGKSYFIGAHGLEKNMQKSYELFSKGAAAGDIDSLDRLAAFYMTGSVVKKDSEKALELSLKAADGGSVTALLNIASIYFEKKDYPKVIEYLKKAVEKGEVKAMLILGLMYKDGEGTDVDNKMAIKYFMMGANLNNAECMTLLGDMYVGGLGVERSLSTGIGYYKKAYDLGSPVAAFALGRIQHSSGNLDEAIKCYEFAAKNGSSEASLALGELYIDKDKVKGITFLENAAEMGNPKAFTKLAEYYIKTKDYDKAFEYVLKANEMGEANSIMALGYMYEHGFHVKKDLDKALEYYSEASKKGVVRAKVYMGSIYREKKDYKKAFECYTEASNEGDLWALFFIADMYRHGEGVNKDFKRAFELYSRCAANNDNEAIFQLGLMYLNGQYVQKDIKKGLEYAERATKSLNNASFSRLLAKIYLGLTSEVVIPKNVNKATSYLLPSAKAGDGASRILLSLAYFKEMPDTPENKIIAYAWFLAAKDVDYKMEEDDKSLIAEMDGLLTPEQKELARDKMKELLKN